MRRINLDHAATTAVAPEVLTEMAAAWALPGNPSSSHGSGREARALLEKARSTVAGLLHVEPGEVFFTSGGTESDNWALRGMAEGGSRPIAVSAIEHHAVLHTADWLEAQGVPVRRLPVTREGVVDLDALEQALTPDTALVSVMTANNETGVLQPVEQIGALCRERGIPFHTDAVQAVGAVPACELCAHADLVSLSGHKFYGPKGIGALIVRKHVKLHRLLHGGAQERGLRAGTENLAGAVGFAAALALAEAKRPGEAVRLAGLRDRLETQLFNQIPGLMRNGAEPRLPGHSSLRFPVRDGRALLMRLDMAGIDVSSGSACASGSADPSHVLLAMGLSREEALASVRLSLGRDTSEADVDEAAALIVRTVRAMQAG